MFQLIPNARLIEIDDSVTIRSRGIEFVIIVCGRCLCSFFVCATGCCQISISRWMVCRFSTPRSACITSRNRKPLDLTTNLGFKFGWRFICMAIEIVICFIVVHGDTGRIFIPSAFATCRMCFRCTCSIIYRHTTFQVSVRTFEVSN